MPPPSPARRVAAAPDDVIMTSRKQRAEEWRVAAYTCVNIHWVGVLFALLMTQIESPLRTSLSSVALFRAAVVIIPVGSLLNSICSAAAHIDAHHLHVAGASINNGAAGYDAAKRSGHAGAQGAGGRPRWHRLAVATIQPVVPPQPPQCMTHPAP